MLHPRVFAYTFVLSGTFILALFVGLVMPRILGWFLPSVEVMSAHEVWRSPTGACFAIRNHKLAQGAPLPPIFFARGAVNAYSDRLNLVVERADEHCKIVNDPLPEHPDGTTWDRYYRFGMPGTIMPDETVTISGYLTHSRWFGDVREQVPEFTMCAVGAALSADGKCHQETPKS